MQIIDSVEAMKAFSADAGAGGKSIALVPTMGYLHEGHLSLLRLARPRADILAVSLFVNPTQFGPTEDLDAYPRDFERDSKLCEREGVDVLFCPAADDMYSPHSTVRVEETALSSVLCGAARPGHFGGVLTVVLKLFNIVRPTIAVFGQKDAQQVRVIKQMVVDLDVPVEIAVGPIVREPDGLAMSSRNTYLSDDEHEQALSLSCALARAAEMYKAGERDANVIREEITRIVSACSLAEIDYAEVVDYGTLAPVGAVGENTLIALAVKIGKTRLIDNLLIQE